LSQEINVTTSTTIDKIALDLVVVNLSPQTMIQGENAILSFQAANFRDGRNTWAFQPYLTGGWETSGTTISNTLQQYSYNSSVEAISDSPYLEYDLYFDTSGVYTLWGLGSGSVYWSFDKDTTHLRKMALGGPPPEWTKFGSFYTKEGGHHTFRVYLAENSSLYLDQWYFTQSTTDYSGQTDPISLSLCPFNTVVRIRSGGTNISAWKSSKFIWASGKFNYEIRKSDSTTGIFIYNSVFLDFWQIGGNSEYFSAWNYKLVDDNESIGDAYKSIDLGATFQLES